MKIKITQKLLYVSEEKNVFICFSKVFLSEINPQIGNSIELPPFKEERQFCKIKQISINLDKNECEVVTNQIVTNNLSDFKTYIQILFSHGWNEDLIENII